MAPSCWTLVEHQARLSTPHVGLASHVTAAIDLRTLRPSLTNIVYGNIAIERAAILGLVLDGDDHAGASQPEDAYGRGGDLVATWPSRGDRSLRVQAYWRCVANIEVPEVVILELQVSVNTPAWDSDARQTVTSHLPTSEVLRMTSSDTASFVKVSVDREAIEVSDQPACFLFRPRDAEFSYAEMVHPADFSGSELQATGDSLSISHRLFVSRLEKGVILRARVRGALMPRQDDERRAAAVYMALAASEPPLTV